MCRRDFALGVAVGGGIFAWLYPLCEYLINHAAGRGMFDIKEK